MCSWRFDDESLDDVKRYFGHKCAPGTVRSHQEVAVPEDNDFRLLLPAAGIESLCRFFNSTEDKVELTNLIQDPKEKQRLTKAYRATLEREEQELRANKLYACQAHKSTSSKDYKSTNRSQEHKITNDSPEGMIISADRPAIRYKIATSLSDSEVYAGMLEDTARMLLEQKGNGALVCLIPDNHDELINAMLEAAKSCHGAQLALCHRETINDLRREFVEEMIESKIVPESMAGQFNELTYLYRGRHQEYFYDERFGTYSFFVCDILELIPNAQQLEVLRYLFNELTYLYRGRHQEYFYDERFGTYSFFVCDILELIPNAQQLEVLRYLKAHEHDDNAKDRYVFVKEDKIPEHLLLRSEAVTAVPFPPIADHSVKILSCNLNALTIPQSVASKTSDPQPLFSIKLS